MIMRSLLKTDKYYNFNNKKVCKEIFIQNFNENFMIDLIYALFTYNKFSIYYLCNSLSI